MPQEHNNSWGMVLSPEHGMDRIAGKISTLGKIWEEKYFCLCYAGFKSRTGRESDMELYAEQVAKAREILRSDLKEAREALHKRERVAAMNRLEQDLDTVMNALWKSPSYSTSSEQLGGDADQDREAP